MARLEALLEWGGDKRDFLFLILSGLALAASIFKAIFLPFDPAWVAIVLCGVPILLEAFIGLVTAFDIKAGLLVSIALVASVCIGEDFAAGEVAFIMQLGALLEDLTVAKARAGIEKLVKLTPRTARRITPAGEEIIPAQDVRVGDLLRVLPGETVPVDGVVRSGQTAIDQAVMTGESLPVDKGHGDPVSSGTVNQFGSFDMVAEKVGEDSSIQRMIRLVQSADAGKAKIVGIADRWATWIVVIALSAAVLTWLFTGEIIRAVTILVVFCPCALVLATPTAIMAAIGNATRHGFLVREGGALERLALVGRAAFDKTGTLTLGVPQVTRVISLHPDWPEDQLFAAAAGVEARSEHPLGKAVVRCCKEKGLTIPEASAFSMRPGRGVEAVVDGVHLLAGSAALLDEAGIALPPEGENAAQVCRGEGCTLIFLAAGGEAVLLTGDHENAARHIAAQLGIDRVQAGCLPEDKLNWISRSQAEGVPVCMVGDGVNDAPALKKAMVGIAMGGVGSDIAVDAADIALVSDDIRELPHLLGLARRMMTTIKLKLTFSMALNFIAIVLAITGILNPVVGALVHNAGSVAVIVNSALLLAWNGKNTV